MDEMVLEVQDWLNTTYGGNSSYTKISEDGITGGTTIAALITALQIELGISPVDGSFGPATLAKCPTLSSTSGTKNEIIILQGALYCKGYNPNGIDGVYGNGVIAAIKQFQSDAGLSTQDGVTTPTIFQAILNTDAYTLISGGDSNIRTIQQKLNNSYSSIIGLIPTNGLYSKSTNVALIKALQHEEGQSVDGLWGPSTMNACPTIPGSKSTKNFVLLLQYSLYCNGYNPNGFDGLYGNGVKTAVTNFQAFVGLTADGYAGPQVWSSLLVSYGDQSRKGTACDCSTTITSEIAQTLKSNGYSVVGRYLTGRYAMTSDELVIIFNNNLKVIPIFEVGGYQLNYFKYLQGMTDGENALFAAKKLGIPDNTIIYFAVDFDALDEDVTNNIIPYFKAISDRFSELLSTYKIGIYGPRNVCSRVSAAGYSVHSFVCDMSSGFSGNLGYKLPADWSFDQISSLALGSSTGLIEIDNNICKGNDSGFNQVDITETNSILDLLKELATYAITYAYMELGDNAKPQDVNRCILDYLRQYKYATGTWSEVVGDLSDFINYMNSNNAEFNSKMLKYISESAQVAIFNDNIIDLPHLSATILGYVNDIISAPLSIVIPNFWTGWGGDLATGMADATNYKNGEYSNEDVEFITENYVVGASPEISSCSKDDINADIDAIYFSEKYTSERFDITFENYYNKVTNYMRKELILVNDLGVDTSIAESDLSEKIYEWMTGSNGFEYLGTIAGDKLLALATTKSGIKPTEEIERATSEAFAKYIFNY